LLRKKKLQKNQKSQLRPKKL